MVTYGSRHETHLRRMEHDFHAAVLLGLEGLIEIGMSAPPIETIDAPSASGSRPMTQSLMAGKFAVVGW